MGAERWALVGVAAFAVCSATPALYVRLRAWAQVAWPLRAVHAGVEAVHAVQRLECRALTALFDATAISVSVPFYAVAFPVLALARAAGACLRKARHAADA